MVGVIGGTGLYELPEFQLVSEEFVDTPFGKPSSSIMILKFDGREIAFLPRHGKNHQFLPSEVNYRANIFALKLFGVTQVLSISAVGSLEDSIQPGDFVIPNQYLDFTKGIRPHTFFGNGLVAHVSTADPVCKTLTTKIQTEMKQLHLPVHLNKTYVCIEGPRFGNRAESSFFRGINAHLVGMTNIPEVYLAREAQLCYCTLAMVTDYDCWKDNEIITTNVVVDQLNKNISKLKYFLSNLLPTIPNVAFSCECRHSLKNALVTKIDSMSKQAKELMELLEK